MQQYKQLDPTEPLNKSIPAMQKSLDTTASMFSGTAFPTENLFQGMPCYRTDLQTIFILRNVATKDWHGIINLNLTSGQAETDGNGDNIADTYLKMDEAGNLYLKKTDASSMYLTKAAAGSTYLTQTAAQSTYTTKTEADNTYETKASAKSHFNKIDYDPDAGTATFTTEGGTPTKITLGKVKTVNGAGPDSNGNITVSTNAIASSSVSNANAWWVKFAGSPGLIIQGGKTMDRSPVKCPISFTVFSIPLLIAKNAGYCFLGGVTLSSFETGATGGNVYVYWIAIGR